MADASEPVKENRMFMFEKATRLKVRFDTPQGSIGVEDLWDVPLTSPRGKQANLDDIARALHKQLKSGDDVSFVHKEKKSDEMVSFKFDVVKHVIDVRVAENEAAKLKADTAAKKQKLLGLIAEKQDKELSNLPVDELLKMVEAL